MAGLQAASRPITSLNAQVLFSLRLGQMEAKKRLELEGPRVEERPTIPEKTSAVRHGHVFFAPCARNCTKRVHHA